MPSPTMSLATNTRERSVEGSFSPDQQYCNDLYEEYRTSSYRKRKLDEIREGRKRFDKDLPAKSFPFDGCSNKTMGLEEIAVTQLEPRIMAQLIGENEFVHPVPVGAEDARNAQYVKEFAEWAFTNNLKLKESMRPVIRNLLLDGTAFVIPLWKETTITNKIRTQVPNFITPDGQPVQLPPQAQNPQMLMQMGIQQAGTREETVDREEKIFKVVLDALPLSDCFLPDTGENWEEQPFLRFIYPTFADLKSATEDQGGPYYNITDALMSPTGRFGMDENDENQDDKDIEHSEFTTEVRLLECYIKWQGEWRLQTYAVDSGFTQVRNQVMGDVYPHGRKPVHRFSINKDPNESLGNGIPNLIKYYSRGVDDLYNVMIDSAMVDVCFQGFLEEGPGIEVIDRDISVGKWIPIPRGSKPYPADKTGIQSVQLISFINLLLSFFERTVSLLDATLPGGGGARGGRGTDTFSGMALIQSEANISMQYEGEGLRDTLEELLTDVLAIYAYYIPSDFKQRIFANNQWLFEPIDIQAIQGAYDIKLNVADYSANRMLSRAEKMEMIQAFSGVPFVNMIRLVEDAFRTYGIKDPGQYIDQNYAMVLNAMQQIPQLPQMIQQMIQQQQQQAADEDLKANAVTNVRRQDIQRAVEEESGAELRKIVDQVDESVKREALRPELEARSRRDIFSRGGVQGMLGGGA